MIRKLVLGLSVVGLLSACHNKQKESSLQTEIDSLRTELQESEQTAQSLQDVGTMIDSIDASRQLLRTDMVEGASYQDYKNRLASIKEYVEESQKKIADLEQRAHRTRGYAGTIKRLKADLDKTTQQLATLEQEVNNVRAENQTLSHNVSMRDSVITINEQSLKEKEENLATLDSQVQQMNVDSKTFQAESYFNQAKAVEEAANRTQFAPRKKKKAKEEALELYRKALEMGKDEAQSKIQKLEKDLG
jgi:chromosome segregation ATPase